MRHYPGIDHNESVFTRCVVLGKCDNLHGILQEATGLRRRRVSLQGHPFYCLEVVLKEGRDLVIKDNCGRSTADELFQSFHTLIVLLYYYNNITYFDNLLSVCIYKLTHFSCVKKTTLTQSNIII